MPDILNRPYPDLFTWREAKRLSQTDAAKLLGISQSTYSRMERGVKFLRGPIAKRIMEQTGVSLEKLVGVA